MNSTIELFQVNAFTGHPDLGSPTGVVWAADDLSEDQMLRIAQLSETSHTAFLADSKQADFSIRFFTADGEIKNCAHATIAAGFLRAEKLQAFEQGQWTQETQTGLQTVELRSVKGERSTFFQQNMVEFQPLRISQSHELLKVMQLGVDDLDLRFPLMMASPGSFRVLMPIADSELLLNLKPDYETLKTWCEEQNCLGCFLYTLEDDEAVLKGMGRMFAPVIGVEEDIINGNSSGCLAACLLRDREGEELDLNVYQGFPFGREGCVKVEARRTREGIITKIGGEAVISKVIEIPIEQL